MKRLLSILSAGAFLALSMGGSAFAGSATANITVSATLNPSCTLTVSTQPPAFNFVPDVTPPQSEGALSAACTQDTPFIIGLNAGLDGSGDGTATPMLSMVNPNSPMGATYWIYSDVGDTTLWGDDVGVNTISGTGTGLLYGQQSFPFYVFAQAPADMAEPGSYTDTVVATLTY